MIIFPAIDIKNGKVVRLRQGQFDQVTEYGTDPLAMGKSWVKEGAEWLHVIDLDGAKTGTSVNFDVIAAVARQSGVPIQVGGGVRSKEDVARLVNAGVSRVIVGTKAIEDRAFLKEILESWPDKVAVSLDCKDKKVALKGWVEVTDLSYLTVAQELQSLGLRYLVYTDISRDGMLSGPDFDGLEALLTQTKLQVIASGGLAKIDDIKKLLTLGPRPLYGAITGKAIYEGTLNLKEAVKLCSPNG